MVNIYKYFHHNPSLSTAVVAGSNPGTSYKGVFRGKWPQIMECNTAHILIVGNILLDVTLALFYWHITWEWWR